MLEDARTEHQQRLGIYAGDMYRSRNTTGESSYQQDDYGDSDNYGDGENESSKRRARSKSVDSEEEMKQKKKKNRKEDTFKSLSLTSLRRVAGFYRRTNISEPFVLTQKFFCGSGERVCFFVAKMSIYDFRLAAIPDVRLAELLSVNKKPAVIDQIIAECNSCTQEAYMFCYTSPTSGIVCNDYCMVLEASEAVTEEKAFERMDELLAQANGECKVCVKFTH